MNLSGSFEESNKKYDSILNNDLKGYGVLNYLSSHDDGQPFDPKREKPFETANRLLLGLGASQVYYGDESARSLIIDKTIGDATLRSFMNWEEINTNNKTQQILNYWQKLGQFRKNHPAIGAGKHQLITNKPYVFSRNFTKKKFTDKVVVGLNLNVKEISVSPIFKNGDKLRDAFSNTILFVKDEKVNVPNNQSIILLEKLN